MKPRNLSHARSLDVMIRLQVRIPFSRRIPRALEKSTDPPLPQIGSALRHRPSVRRIGRPRRRAQSHTRKTPVPARLRPSMMRCGSERSIAFPNLETTCFARRVLLTVAPLARFSFPRSVEETQRPGQPTHDRLEKSYTFSRSSRNIGSRRCDMHCVAGIRKGI